MDRKVHKKIEFQDCCLVSGIILEGRVKKGETLLVCPSEKRVKVERIEHFNERLECAEAGTCVSILLKGVTRKEVKSGSVLQVSRINFL